MPKITVLPDRVTIEADADQTLLAASPEGGISHTNLCGRQVPVLYVPNTGP
jgi:hypothetical protein